MIKRLVGSNVVIWSTYDEVVDLAVKVGDQSYALYRSIMLRGQRGVLCISVPPSDLTQSEITHINYICDREEGPKNKVVKSIISQAICEFFNDVSIELYDIGCGERPIIDYIPANINNITFTGIDIDSNHIESLKARGLNAYHDWSQVIANIGSSDKPRVATGIYSLQMLVSKEMIRHMAYLINDAGFFIGNFYVDPRENITGDQRKKLKDILKHQNLHHVEIDDSNYWIIFKRGAFHTVQQFQDRLVRCMAMAKNPSKGFQGVRP